MTNSTVKAVVAPVKIGHLTIEGLMMPNGDFAIAVPQVARLFSFDTNQASRALKSLLGKDSPFDNAKTELNSKPVNIMSLPEFESVTLELALKGSEPAIAFQRSLVGMALHQLFCDAFNIKFDKTDRQNWLKERQHGKGDRRSLTDAAKFLIERGEDLNYAAITIKTYGVCGLLSQYHEYKRSHKDAGFRDTLSSVELKKVAKFEELTADYVMVDLTPINDAMSQASRYIR